MVFFFYFCVLFTLDTVRYFIEISYLGTHLHGWQLQKKEKSVQGEIEAALSLILGQKIGIHGSSRTDTGVHARQQFAHFDIDSPLANCKALALRLNSFLHDDISIKNIFLVQERAHSRFDAIGRKYIYRIIQNKDPFKKDYTALYTVKVDVELMNQAASILLKHIDFKSFCKARTSVYTYDCSIQAAHWRWENDVLEFHISANRFLRGMVRTIVGTLMDVGYRKTSLEEFEAIIVAQDRKEAGTAVKAEGLTLERVYYPEGFLNSEEE